MAQQQSKVPPRGQAARRAGTRPSPERRSPPGSGRGGLPRKYLYGLALLLAIALVVVVVVATVTGGSSKAASGSHSAVGYTLPDGTKVYGPLGPENVPLEVGPQLAPANAALTGATIDGVQCGTTEQLAYHHHVHLALFVDGKPYSMPLGVGMAPTVQVSQTAKGPFADGSTKCLYWLHVHAADGIVHIESPEVRTFELGQVFDIWHVDLSSTRLGSYSGKLTATINGKPWTGDPKQIPLDEHAQIVLNLGSPVVSPPPISWSGTGL